MERFLSFSSQKESDPETTSTELLLELCELELEFELESELVFELLLCLLDEFESSEEELSPFFSFLTLSSSMSSLAYSMITERSLCYWFLVLIGFLFEDDELLALKDEEEELEFSSDYEFSSLDYKSIYYYSLTKLTGISFRSFSIVVLIGSYYGFNIHPVDFCLDLLQ